MLGSIGIPKRDEMGFRVETLRVASLGLLQDVSFKGEKQLNPSCPTLMFFCIPSALILSIFNLFLHSS